MVTIAPFGSAVQLQSLALRYEVLRKPLGLHFDPAELRAEHSEIHVVHLHDNLVTGCMLLKPVNADILKMRQVAVSQEFQKQGIGAKMVQFAEEYASQNGYKTIELHARASAVPFYLGLQYHCIGDEFLEVEIPHFKMEKQLQ